jgi:anthranilate phosphoribosyltransferase
MDRIIESLKILGARRAMVVHGQGMDEISTLGTTKICLLMGEHVSTIQLNPVDLGIKTTSIDELQTGDAIANAQVIRGLLLGREKGPRRDIVVLNAAAALIVADLAEGFEAGIELAAKSIDQGRALMCLEKLIEVSNGR